jgi:hypothetical protein
VHCVHILPLGAKLMPVLVPLLVLLSPSTSSAPSPASAVAVALPAAISDGAFNEVVALGHSLCCVCVLIEQTWEM